MLSCLALGLAAKSRRSRLAIQHAAYRAIRNVVVESLEQRTLFSDSSLVAWYKLDETAGNLAADSSDYGNDGTWINNPTPTAGQIGGALTFSSSGGNRRVSVPDAPILDISGPITLSAWIRPTARTTQYVIKKADSDAVDGYELSLSSTGRVFFRLNDFSTGDTYRIDSSSTYPTNGSTWMHIAGTYDGSTMRLYINGQLQASKSASIAIVTNNLNLGIGGEAGGYRSINGAVDDARVYHRALSAAEIVDVMNYTGEPANAAPVVDAGTDKAITLPDNSVVLVSSVTDDGLPNPPQQLTQNWSVVSAPDGGTVTFYPTPAIYSGATFNIAGVYVLRLTASDGTLSSFDDVQITVSPEPVNQAPVVNAGPDQTVVVTNGAILAGSFTDDGLPQNTITKSWSMVDSSTGGTAIFSDAGALDSGVSFTMSGVFTLRLTVRDGEFTSSDDLVITVNDAPVNQPPVVNAGPDRSAVAQSTNNIDATVTDDAISQPVTYSWTVFSQPTGSTVGFGSANAVDTTVEFSTAGTYILRLTVSDGQYTVSDDVTFDVTDYVNQPPQVSAGPNQTIALPNNTVIVSGSAEDDYGPLDYQWSVVSQPNGSTVNWVEDDALEAQATFSQAGTYVLRLTVTDTEGLFGTADVTITVNPAPSGGVDVDVDRDTLNNISLNRNTEHKPQNKLWEAFGTWWAVLAANDGTWVYRLDNSTWNKVLKLTNDTNTTADVLAVGAGNVVHALLQVGTTMKLASIEYVSGGNGSYKLWDDRSSIVTIGSKSGLEAATIELDSTGRLWVAYDGSSTVHVRSATGTFSSWSSEQTIASGISSDDLSSIVKLDGQIGVFWSNQNTERFGFRTHTDGAGLTSWSSNEVPGDDAALNIGDGMADDHLHVAVGSDGTLYVVVKTSYDTSGQTTIGLLVRRPNGQWDDELYRVDTAGTRPTVVINELENALYVFYTGSTTSYTTIYYRKTSLNGPISFGSRQTAISGAYNNVTTTRQRVTGELVVMATNSSNSAASAKFTFTPTSSMQFVGSLFYDGDEKIS